MFDELPDQFPVQLGHNDRVSAIGAEWQALAASDRCPFQVIRSAENRIRHPVPQRTERTTDCETASTLYRESYAAAEAEYNEILRTLRPSVLADGLMARFLELYA